MNKDASVINGFLNGPDTISKGVDEPIADFFSLPGFFQETQVLHKLRRILSEIRYAEINNDKFRLLTGREKEIIKLIVSGCNNPQISKKLFISRRTVEQHRKNINRKLKMHSLPEICVFAYAFNMV
jgi:DNA-binding NarL/FixJ family response regulator